MWIVLAVITFLAGQVYLFHCLGILDRFLQQPREPAKQETLRIIFSDPSTAEDLARILGEFSESNPDTKIIYCTGTDVTEAVASGKASVGILPAGHPGISDLEVSPIRLCAAPMRLCQSDVTVISIIPAAECEIVWRAGASRCADTMIRYLREHGYLNSGNGTQNVI